MVKAAILTVSDSCQRGDRDDASGQTIREMLLSAKKFDICENKVVGDEEEDIKKELVYFADRLKVDIVFTTGGTGLGPRDVTPEATAAVCDRMVPGFAEAMRSEGFKKTKRAILSRSLAGVRGQTLIINLPGSPKGVKESLEIILDILPHASDMLKGQGHNFEGQEVD